MRITVNGEIKILNSKGNPSTLDYVIKALGHQSDLVVVEFNGVILPPNTWEKQEVTDGDILEIVTIVGGGS